MTDDQYSPLVQDQKLLNEVKYAARDFVSIADDLLRRLKIEYEEVYNDYATTDQGIMLRDLCAWAYAALTWYLDRTASDCFLATARTRAAVERLVEQIGYKMSPAAAGSTPVTLTFPNGSPGPFEMKSRWRYQSTSGYPYESYAKFTQPTALSPGDQIEVGVRQGETRTLTYTSNGSKNQTYRLTSVSEDRFLGANNVEVWVDGGLWEEKDFLEFQADNQNHYEVSYLADPPIVRFGDGLAGAIPPAGAEVKIRFLIIDGEKGSVTSDSIQTSIDTLTVAGQAVNFTVTNSRPARGRDPEKAESAKRWAPVSFAARGAAITQQDYEGLASSFVDPSYGGVAKAYAINPRTRYDDLVFNELIIDVEDILRDFNTNVSALEVAIGLSSDEMAVILAALVDIHTTLGTYRAEMSGWAGAINTNAVNYISFMEVAEAKATIARDKSDTALTRANALRDMIQNGGSTTQEMLEEADAVINAATSALEESDGSRVAAGSAKDGIYTGVLPYARFLIGYLQNGGEVEEQLDSMQSNVTSMDSVVGDIESNLSAIEGEADTAYNDVNGKLGDMQTRIGDLFSDDCLSNYVQVPILSLDLDGNYVAPSIGLRSRLQTRLNAIKEVTQVVEVVDGSSSLVRAEVEVKVSILDAYIPSEVVSQIRSTIVGMLKRRSFNSPLYLDDLYTAVKQIDGIDYVNIVIVGPVTVPPIIDTDGNLVPPENSVIVYGSLVIMSTDGDVIG
jgi:hypothetical protein